MPVYDLNQPLRRKPSRVPDKPRRAALFGLATFLLMISGVAVWVAIVDDPNAGYPEAVALIEDTPLSTGSVAGSDPVETLSADGGRPSIPDETAIAALPAAPSPGEADPGLIEPSAYGPLPRVSPDGRRPRDAYARRSPAVAPGMARVAIVVGGLGLSQTGTQRAIEELPEDITLAFAPLGSSLKRWVTKARAEGHEILLQVPMEPLGYPEQNPGEHTLLVSSDHRATKQDLHWTLGRLTAYAGVMNYMGARFTAEDGALAAFLGEIGERGLFYVDDGSSPDSRASVVGEALQVPVATADWILDGDRSRDAITEELRKLEVTARSRGTAVGVASAFPDSVAAIAAWAREAESRGIAIVPVSAALGER